MSEPSVYPFLIALDRIDEDGSSTVDGHWYPLDVDAARAAVIEALTTYLARMNIDFETLHSTSPEFYRLWRAWAALEEITR